MEIYKLEKMKDGWFVGDFEPSVYKTKGFEIGYRVHYKGENWGAHYHKIGTEINLLVSGKMIIQNKELCSGDIFILHPFEIADPVFIEDCTVLIIKTPSSPKDKFLI